MNRIILNKIEVIKALIKNQINGIFKAKYIDFPKH